MIEIKLKSLIQNDSSIHRLLYTVHMDSSKKRKSKKKSSKEDERYIETFTDKERKAYEIAQDHLQSSFTLTKSLGFIKWKSE